MPRNYLKGHEKIGDWKRDKADRWLSEITGNQDDADKYDSTKPNFLKKETGNATK
jgi:hypothetical protein